MGDKEKEEVSLRPSKRRKAVIIDKKISQEEEEQQQKQVKKQRERQRVEGEEEDESNAAAFDMGYKIEPFNLKNERTEGEFDREGNYLMDRRKKGDIDAWVDEEYEEQIRLYTTSGKKLPDTLTKTENVFDVEAEKIDAEQLKKEIYNILLPKETVTQALKRLGKEKKPKVPKGKVREETPFDKLTEASHALLSNGFFNIYSTSREAILGSKAKTEEERGIEAEAQNIDSIRKRPHAESSAENQQTTDEGTMWEYKAKDGQVYGPFTTQHMVDWKEQGYFVGDNVVDVRKVQKDDNETPWKKSDRIDFSDYL